MILDNGIQAVRTELRMLHGRPHSWAAIDAEGAGLPERLEANELVVVMIDDQE